MEELGDCATEQDALKQKDSTCCDDRTSTESTKTTSDHQPQQTEVSDSSMLFQVEDCPPWYLCILLAIQQSLTCIGSNVALPLVLASAMCITDYTDVSYVITSVIFVQGIVTLLQSTFGTRLPIVQGATASFLTPTFAILNLPQWRCPAVGVTGDNDVLNSTTPAINFYDDVTGTDFIMHNGSKEISTADDNRIWLTRMREIQGAIAVAAIFQVLIGLSGLIGFVLRYIGPLSVGPTITLVGLSLYPPAAAYASKQWFVAIGTAALILLFSQYLRNVQVPCCFIGRISSRKKKTFRCSKIQFRLFTLFPVLLAIILAWIFCIIMTVTGAIPNDPSHWSFHARTDLKIRVLHEASWFRFPYPFQWGVPTVSLAAVLGMTAGVLAGIMESLGDYYACARISGAPPPPVHAINRGVLIEGIGCIIAAIWGGGTGSTSYSENVGAIGITKVSSRLVVQVTAVLLLIYGMIGKLGALFVTIPDPIFGGIFLVLFGLIAAVGISNLQFVDLNSSRNLCIFGVAVFVGLVVPHWISSGKYTSTINTGNESVDQIITILLSTNMFVGGAIGFILDNTIPGTLEERGMSRWRELLLGGVGTAASNHHQNRSECYELPSFFKRIVDTPVSKYIPVCPPYIG